MIFWLIVGIAIGYFFRPQINSFLRRIARMIDDNRRGGGPPY